MNTVDEFIEVNKRLFALSDERVAREHIASLQNEDARGMAELLWKMEKLQRQTAA